jgi:CxxC-x17-CxxC domain-containing protein
MSNYQTGRAKERSPYIGGRPRSDADYGTKKRLNKNHGNNKERRFGATMSKSRDQKEMQLFSATCTTCGKSCEVPFRPDGSKPVLCRDCFSSKNQSPVNRNSTGNFNRKLSNDSNGEVQELTNIKVQLLKVEQKLELILDLLNNFATTKSEVDTTSKPLVQEETVKKVARKKSITTKK